MTAGSHESSLTPQQIKRYRERLQGNSFRPFLSKPWQQERAIRKLAADGTPDAVAGLADGVVANRFLSAALRAEVIALLEPLLSRLQNVESINALCYDWMEKGLAAALHAAAIVPLATRLQNVAIVDKLCRHWIESGELDLPLMHLLLDAEHAPSEPAQRAIFWLLSGKIQRYEELDLDGSLLTQAHANASPTLRKRLAAAAAAAGRLEWLSAMEQSKPLEAFTKDDWATTMQLLTRVGDLETLWEWALKTPPIYSRLLLQRIPAGTAPPQQFGEGAKGLQRHAMNLPALGDQNQLPPEHCNHILSAHNIPSGHTSVVWSIAWSPDGRCIASGSHDHTIRLWDPATGACTHILSGHANWVNSIAWSPDGRCIASGSHDHTIRLWDPATGACTHTLTGGLSERGCSIAWSPDGRCLASGSMDRTIRLWDPASGACTHTLSGHANWANSIAWSPDGRCLASGSMDSTIRLWDPASSACTQTLTGGLSVRGYPIAWSPDGRCLASGSMDGTIRFWDPASGACTHTLSGHATWANSIAWSPDGRCLASGSYDSTIRLWDPASGACTHTLTDHRSFVSSIAWSPDGRCLASGSHDCSIRFWDPATGACTHTIYGHTCEVLSIAWSPDGRCIASHSLDRRFRLWSNELFSLLSLPLACYGIDQWNLLSDLQKQNKELQEWKRPWLEFIAALGSLIRRFDVSLDNQSSKPASSKFEIEIDG